MPKHMRARERTVSSGDAVWVLAVPARVALGMGGGGGVAMSWAGSASKSKHIREVCRLSGIVM